MREHRVPPRSAGELNEWITDLADEASLSARGKALRKNFATAVLAQMLPDNAYLKGGAALGLRYSLSEARTSRDVDSVYQGSKEAFFAGLRDRLDEGWEGFTGEVSYEERRSLPKGVELETLFITLYYKQGRFTKISFEASPDINGHDGATEYVMDDGMRAMFARMGFTMRAPRMLGLDAQLAEKLNGVTNPKYVRGRDLRDIELIMRHHTPDLTKLREYVRASERREGGHEVHVITDREMQEYENAYMRAGGTGLETAWELTDSLLEQVDCDYGDRWLDQWGDEFPQRRQHWTHIASVEARITRAYLEQQQPEPATAMPPLPHGGPVQVRSYTRKDGTVVRGHTRRR